MFIFPSINCTLEFININKVLHVQTYTWSAKCPIFLGNFTPKTSNYCLKKRALGFPGMFKNIGFHWLSLNITASSGIFPPGLPPKTSAALFVSKDAPFNKEMGKTALASCHFGRSPQTEMWYFR